MEILPGMAILLEAEDGPVGLFVNKKTLQVVDGARQNVGRIMHRLEEKQPAKFDELLNNVTYEQEGTEAIVGIEDAGSISVYLADKEAFELAWLFPAVQDAFPAE